MKRRLSTIMGMAAAFLLVTISIGCLPEITSRTATGPTTLPPVTVPAPTDAPAPTEPAPVLTPPVDETALPDIAAVVAAVKPSVVAINVESVAYDFFNQPVRQQGAGSGWVVDPNGYIVTNNHVVEGAETVNVTLDDGRVFTAQKVSTDKLTDLAVVRIDANGLPALKLGDSSKLAIGDWVVAIGNSLGMGTSATQGIVSALNVSLSESSGETVLGLIQTDAAINPGNSGGPLVNMAGDVVGINSAKIAEVGVEGMGYAISINEARPVINQLMTTGYIPRPWFGASLYTLSPQIARHYGLAVQKGVLITEVAQDSPAAQSGLEAGDVITAFGDQEISNTDEWNSLINSYNVGDNVQVTYWRGRAEKTTYVILGESP